MPSFRLQSLSACDACGREFQHDPAELELDLTVCRDHSWQEIVACPKVFTLLRRVEVDYFQRHMRHPALLVWASHSLLEVRQDAREAGVLRMPDGLRVLLVPDDASPRVFAVDDVLAHVFLSVYKDLKRPEPGQAWRHLRIDPKNYAHMVETAQSYLRRPTDTNAHEIAELFLVFAGKSTEENP